jgi:hypothetical protein
MGEVNHAFGAFLPGIREVFPEAKIKMSRVLQPLWIPPSH